MKSLILLCIMFYQRTLSPDHGWWRQPGQPVCRFTPTCSEYMSQAIEHYGALKGLGLGLRRAGRCHPFHPGGHDPVIKKGQP